MWEDMRYANMLIEKKLVINNKQGLHARRRNDPVLKQVR